MLSNQFQNKMATKLTGGESSLVRTKYILNNCTKTPNEILLAIYGANK